MTMRTIIDLPDHQLDSLAELCRQGRISTREPERVEGGFDSR